MNRKNKQSESVCGMDATAKPFSTKECGCVYGGSLIVYLEIPTTIKKGQRMLPS
jgi:hypothetical protein